MALLITDFVVTFPAATGIHIPGPQQVIASPTTFPLFVVDAGGGSTYYETSPPTYRAATPSPQTGQFSIYLPWPSEQDPSSTQWQIQMPDGAIWIGTVPQGVNGPVTIKQLKDTYSWKAAAVTTQIAAVAGPPGPTGATGATGQTGPQGPPGPGASETVTADGVIDQFALIKASLTTDNRYVMISAAEPATNVLGTALTAATGVGVSFTAIFTQGLQTTLLSDGTAVINRGDPLVPSSTVAGRVMTYTGTNSPIAIANTTVAATLNAQVQAR